MNDVQQDVTEWLHAQADWLQEAADRLLVSGSLSEADVRAVAALLKTPAGQQASDHRKFNGLMSNRTAASEMRLVSIGNVSGIENLSPRTPLTFGTGNLCVVYGNNGSGKSGFTRILKRACGKPRAPALKPNVFGTAPTARQCKITYAVAGTDRDVDWPADGRPIDDLRVIDIFDAEVAVDYLTRESDVSYTPPLVAMFEALARSCDQVKAAIQQEQNQLVSRLPVLPAQFNGTTAGVAYTRLTSDIDSLSVSRITLWTEKNRGDLDELTERLRINDPATAAQKKRSTKAQVIELAALVQATAASVNAERIEVVRRARTDAVNKRDIATEAARVTAASARLDGIGTGTWNALWEAARRYSQIAYPGATFPVTDDGAVCVLCQQALAPEGQQRVRDFEAFVQGAVAGAARDAEAAYQALLGVLPTPQTDQSIRTRCEAAGLSVDDWGAPLTSYWGAVGKTCDTLRAGEAKEKAVPVPLPKEILDGLSKRADELEREAAFNDADVKTFDRAKATEEKVKLEAQHWVHQQADAIREEVVRLQRRQACEGWLNLANSRIVSLKAGDIAEKVITEAYVDRFNREMKELGGARLKVELVKTRTEKGRVLHQLRLRGAPVADDPPSVVLSEGERRIVSLAAFLADVAEKPHAAPFIFDDPISSLDQDFEWQVAARLARLAKDRQVLVFTHRLSLYGAMEDAAKKIGEKWKDTNLEQRYIESFAGTAGHPADEAAWNANTKKANNILLARLDNAIKVGESHGADAYRMQAQSICTEFRKLLERTVEDDLLGKVVQRHRRSVTTDHRLGLLAHITQDDCKFIDDLMTKYSCYEHSQSQEAPAFLPDEPELRADLEALKQWREGFTKRPAASA